MSLNTTSTSQISETQQFNAQFRKDMVKRMLNRLMILFVLNIIDLAIIAFFCCYDILVLPEPILVSADIFYVLSLILLLFAIKFKHGYCLGMSILCQLAAFGLKIGGFMYSEDRAVKIVTLIMMLVMAGFTIVPISVARFWNKVDEQHWTEKFDKDIKMSTYKNPHAHFEHE